MTSSILSSSRSDEDSADSPVSRRVDGDWKSKAIYSASISGVVSARITRPIAPGYVCTSESRSSETPSGSPRTKDRLWLGLVCPSRPELANGRRWTDRVEIAASFNGKPCVTNSLLEAKSLLFPTRSADREWATVSGLIMSTDGEDGEVAIWHKFLEEYLVWNARRTYLSSALRPTCW
jgi:hypothetical protein